MNQRKAKYLRNLARAEELSRAQFRELKRYYYTLSHRERDESFMNVTKVPPYILKMEVRPQPKRRVSVGTARQAGKQGLLDRMKSAVGKGKRTRAKNRRARKR